MTGTVYSIAPIPPDPEHTTYVDCGAVRIGVEYRLLDQSELEAAYRGEDLDEIRAAVGDQTVQDNGVSLHVVGGDDGHEYLRFDLFEHDPHYHYIEPSGAKQTIVQFDAVAMGPMLPWAIEQLRSRLVPMLEFAGGAAVAARVQADRIAAALGRVEELARAAEAELRGQAQPGR